MAEPIYSEELLDAFARCFAEAAVRRLIAESSVNGTNSMTQLDKHAGCANREPELFTRRPAPASSEAATPDAATASRTIPVVSP